MTSTDLAKFLDDEIQSLADAVRLARRETEDFWDHPESPALAVWGEFPSEKETPEPADGTVTEKELFLQLVHSVKPALEARNYGFASGPLLAPHDRLYAGPPFGTHFLPVVLGAAVRFPDGTEPRGWNAQVKPRVTTADDVSRIEDVDVEKSPALQAILAGIGEMSEIVRGRIPLTCYAPTFPLDLAADLAGHERFFEWLHTEPETLNRLLDVCLDQWVRIVRLQERAAGAPLVNYLSIPGTRVSDMILPFLSPATIREAVIPHNQKFARIYGRCAAEIHHADPVLLKDFLSLPGLAGLGVPVDWPAEAILRSLSGKFILLARYNRHYHPGEVPPEPVYFPWEDCRRQMAGLSGKMRVLVHLSALGRTPQERRRRVREDLDELRRLWP